MKIKIIHVGKTNSKDLSNFIDEFVKRSSRFSQLTLSAVEPHKSKKAEPVLAKKKEGERIQALLSETDKVILLDEKGKRFSSRNFAKLISEHFLYSGGQIVFVIGGAYGFSDEIYTRSDLKVSLSEMTLNHELALAVFTEQVYRALTIINGHPYHND